MTMGGKKDPVQSAVDSTLPDKRLAVPDHEVLRPVGTGSYGEVWLAKSVMGTFRAVKIISRQSFRDERPFEREFEGIQKFEPVSRSHSGLVSILHVGRNEQDGYFYYVMEVADDAQSGPAINPETYCPRTLSLDLRHGRLPLDRCLQIGLSLAAGLAHLHEHGLVHRDIKPSNIIFVNGRPKFADIGLVTEIGEKATWVGTHGYMPPEGPGSPRADVYSLGMVLYQISMGKSPEEFPELPTNFRELTDAPGLMQLNEIILKACAPDAAKRFQSAEQLYTELQRLAPHEFAELKPVARTPRGSAQRTGRVVAILNVGTGEADLHLATVLQENLAAAGYVVFTDRCENFDSDWARDIEQRIRSADAVVALLSASSIRSETLAYELELAHQSRQMQSGKPRLLPIRVQFASVLPRHFTVALEGSEPLVWERAEDDGPLAEQVRAALQVVSS